MGGFAKGRPKKDRKGLDARPPQPADFLASKPRTGPCSVKRSGRGISIPTYGYSTVKANSYNLYKNRMKLLTVSMILTKDVLNQ